MPCGARTAAPCGGQSVGFTPPSSQTLISLTQAEATTAITDLGLLVGAVTPQASASVQAGSVIAQTPLAGVVVTAGAAVALVVSSGPALVAVPNVVRLTQAASVAAGSLVTLVVSTGPEALQIPTLSDGAPWLRS